MYASKTVGPTEPDSVVSLNWCAVIHLHKKMPVGLVGWRVCANIR